MVIVVGSIARCIIVGVPRLSIRACDERPPAMYGHFCLVPRVSVHDRYYCICKSFYAYVRSKQNVRDRVGPLVDNDGNIITQGSFNGRRIKYPLQFSVHVGRY